MDFVIEPEYEGKTIKDFLKCCLRLSRNMLIILKNKSDGITANGNRATVRFVLSKGDVLGINYEDIDEMRKGENFVAENQSLLGRLEIIYEDDFLLAANKPPDMPSHPSINHYDDTLANLIVTYFKNKNVNFFYRAANRLDKNTSGLVLVAKDKITSAALNDMMKRGEIKKTYIAVLQGNIEGFAKETNRIIAPIKREQDSIIKRVCAEGGDYAETEFKFLKTDGRLSVVEAYPKTGRTHQIRLHFHAAGFPLLGEDLYCENLDPKIGRHMLHSFSLEFAHPKHGEKLIIKCEPPEDMKRIMKDIAYENILHLD